MEEENAKITMTVDIGDGETGTISISASDSPEELAKAFAFKHGLEKELEKSLARLIKQNKDIMIGASSSRSSVSEEAKQSFVQITEHHAEEEESSSPTITQKQTVFNREKAEEEVFKRLYSQRKPISRSSGIKNSSHTLSYASAPPVNHCVALYEQGKMQKQVSWRKSLAKKMQSQEKVDKELTFKPVINESSNLVSPRVLHKTEDLLIKSIVQKRENICDLANHKAQEMMRECTFSPSIDPLSSLIDQYKNQPSPRFERLFDNAKVKEDKMLKLSENADAFPFKPTLVAKQQNLDDKTREACIQRLLYSKERFNRLMDEARRKKESLVDEKTGQPLFRPITGRSPESPRPKEVWEHLYILGRESANLSTKEPEHWRSLTEVPKTTEITDKIYQDFKLKRYMKIFSRLDADEDGVISEENADWSTLDEKTAEVVRFAISKAGENNVKFSIFVEKIDPIVMRLGVEERAWILKRDETAHELTNHWRESRSQIQSISRLDLRSSVSIAK